jgi:Protein of unknown function (DUF1559)
MTRRAKTALAISGAILILSCGLLLPCVQTIRDGEGWVYPANSLKQIGMAIENYHEVSGHLPADIISADGAPLLSWRVALLPFVEQQPLYTEFRPDEPWDSGHNKTLLEKMPRVYRTPKDPGPPPYTTRFQSLLGPGTAFERRGLTWADFPDGRSNTLLVVEAGNPVPWSKPGDISYDPNGPLPALGSGYTKTIKFVCYEVGHRPGFVACFADGSVRFIRQSVDEKVLRALITRNGGEAVDLSDAE